MQGGRVKISQAALFVNIVRIVEGAQPLSSPEKSTNPLKKYIQWSGTTQTVPCMPKKILSLCASIQGAVFFILYSAKLEPFFGCKGESTLQAKRDGGDFYHPHVIYKYSQLH